MNRDPYQIIKRKHTTEKSVMLENLKDSTQNKSSARCNAPKYVFIVDKRANKQEIAKAVEEIYSERRVHVTSVNTINTKPKERRVRGRLGMRPAYKKAIVTLEPGDSLDSSKD